MVSDVPSAPTPQTAIIKKRKPDEMQAFRLMLQQGRFVAALKAWPETKHVQARKLILLYSHDLRRSGLGRVALRLLDDYMDQFPDDSEAGIRQANLLHQLHHFRRESFLLMNILHKTADAESVGQVKKNLQDAIDAETSYLMQLQNYRSLLKFYRHLSSLDGGNWNFMLMQAKVLIRMGKLSQASAILQPLLFGSGSENLARVQLDKIDRIESAHYQVTIPIHRSGEHFLVPVSINGGAPLQLLIDTGASITLVRAQDGQIPDNAVGRHPIKLQTVNGSMQVPVFTASTVTLGGFNLHDVELGVITGPVANQAEGLLGMNILKHL